MQGVRYEKRINRWRCEIRCKGKPLRKFYKTYEEACAYRVYLNKKKESGTLILDEEKEKNKKKKLIKKIISKKGYFYNEKCWEVSAIVDNVLYRTRHNSREEAREQLNIWESGKTDLPKGKEIKERKKDNYSFIENIIFKRIAERFTRYAREHIKDSIKNKLKPNIPAYIAQNIKHDEAFKSKSIKKYITNMQPKEKNKLKREFGVTTEAEFLELIINITLDNTDEYQLYIRCYS